MIVLGVYDYFKHRNASLRQTKVIKKKNNNTCFVIENNILNYLRNKTYSGSIYYHK